VGPRTGLDSVLKSKSSQPLPGLEPPFIQPVAQRYKTEIPWLFLFMNLELLFLLWLTKLFSCYAVRSVNI
jgi:hypothetical protein